MMPIIMATQRDIVKSLMVRLSLPQFCPSCGAVHPDKAEQVKELEQAIRGVLNMYRVRHVLDGGDALIDDHSEDLKHPFRSDDQPERSSHGGYMPGLHLEPSGGDT